MATTYTLPDGSLLTKPAYADTADVNVINTSMQNMANNITSQSNIIKNLNCTTTYSGGVNPDSYTTTGAYHVGIAAAYSPIGSDAYGVLMVEVGQSGLITQIFLKTGTEMFIRTKSNSDSAWTYWKGLAPSITISSDNVAEVYAMLNGIFRYAIVVITATAMTALSQNTYRVAGYGIVYRVSSSNYRFMMVVGAGTSVDFDITGMSSSSWGTLSVVDYSKLVAYSDVEDTTSASGNIALEKPTGYQVPIFAHPIGTTANTYYSCQITYFSGQYFAKVLTANGTALASTSAKIRVYWLKFNLAVPT